MSGAKRFTYRVVWSDEDDAWVGTVDEFASLSWVADNPTAAAAGIRRLVRRIGADQADGDATPNDASDRSSR